MLQHPQYNGYTDEIAAASGFTSNGTIFLGAGRNHAIAAGVGGQAGTVCRTTGSERQERLDIAAGEIDGNRIARAIIAWVFSGVGTGIVLIGRSPACPFLRDAENLIARPG